MSPGINVIGSAVGNVALGEMANGGAVLVSRAFKAPAESST